MSWIAGYIRGKMEFEFQRNMLKHGIPVYVPSGKRRVKLRRIKKWVVVSFPAFPNYVFIESGDDVPWTKLNSDPAFLYCVGTGGCDGPLVLEDAIISKIRRAEEIGAFDNDASFALFRPKTKVRVNAGPFIGRAGVVEQLVNGQTGRVVVDIEGKIAKVNVDFLEIIY